MSIKAMNWAWQVKGIRPSEKLVLMKLADHSNDDGVAWPGKASIAEACEVSKRTVDAHVRKLEDLGLLKVERRKLKKGLHDTNVYYLNLEQIPLFDSADSAPVQNLQGCKKNRGGGAKNGKKTAISAPEPPEPPIEPITGTNVPEPAAPNLWDIGKKTLGIKASVIGKWILNHGEPKVAECIAHMSLKKPADPVQYGAAWLQERPKRLVVPSEDDQLVPWAHEHGFPKPGDTETYKQYRSRLWGLTRSRQSADRQRVDIEL